MKLVQVYLADFKRYMWLFLIDSGWKDQKVTRIARSPLWNLFTQSDQWLTLKFQLLESETSVIQSPRYENDKIPGNQFHWQLNLDSRKSVLNVTASLDWILKESFCCLLENSFGVGVWENLLRVHRGSDFAKGVKHGVIFPAYVSVPLVHFSPVRAATEGFHESFKSWKIWLVRDVLTIWSVHNDANPAGIATIGRREPNVVALDKSNLDRVMHLEIALLDELP